MLYQQKQCKPTGQQEECLVKHEFIPEKPLGGAIFLHGLGDHSQRNSRPIHRFVNSGIHCVAIDLPGHGLSSGPRGYIPDFEFVYEIIDSEIICLQQKIPVNSPLGILGHSMGGFIALNYLSSTQYQEYINFAWISSPLTQIQLAENKVLYGFLKLIDAIAPRLTITYPLNSENCKRDVTILEETRSDSLIHRQITIHLLKLLAESAQVLPIHVKAINPELKILMTHGDADVVCSSRLSKELFNLLPCIDKRYVLFKDSRHETFHDIGKERVYEVLDQWILSVLNHKAYYLQVVD
jgi:alpha-beta hydrolase superfamily lysophospholipase